MLPLESPLKAKVYKLNMKGHGDPKETSHPAPRGWRRLPGKGDTHVPEAIGMKRRKTLKDSA